MLIATLAAATATADAAASPSRRGDRLIADYFRAETRALADRCLADITTLETWTARRDGYRRQLLEMLGLEPMPERTDLRAVITGRIERTECTVEKLQFQSRPGLYVTATLYLPKDRAAPAPAVLYLCGHAPVKKDGISFGNKAAYQHHGAWLAQNGYVCLILDTLQLGEIEGLHHGTYREGMWWWNARGYTPAGVETWNAIRALDYLQSRPEVDGARIGVTGRSGGGAYSWYLAAVDERVKVAVPVAGITDLENHVVDGCVTGHCDCMYLVNTYRWDYPLVAALVAPRPLLISNSDKDSIFPLEGVVRTHAKVRAVYRLYDAADKLGLQITEGDHNDTQELRLHALTWFNRHLKGKDPPIETTARALFAPEELRVFEALPEDAINARIHETFVLAAAPPEVPATPAAWTRQRETWLAWLRERVFGGWPETPEPPNVETTVSVERNGVRLRILAFNSQRPFRLPLCLLDAGGRSRASSVTLRVLDEVGWQRLGAALRHGFGEVPGLEALPEPDAAGFARLRESVRGSAGPVAFFAPRGVGPTAWDASEPGRTQLRRRFMLLGQTLDGIRVWDVRRAVQALGAVEGLTESRVTLRGEGPMSAITLYAALFEPRITGLELGNLPGSHRDGPDFLNVLRALDIPQAVALAVERCSVRLHGGERAAWEYPLAVTRRLGWEERLEVLPPGTERE